MSIESTLHGYRVQFLYTLYRMLVSNNPQEVFVPEGKEDLDIYVDEILNECIQIKCHAGTLTYRDLYSTGRKTSLYSRAICSLDKNSKVKIRIVSINGKISNELTDKAKLKRKLKGDSELKLKDRDAKNLATIVDAAVFNEQEMLSSISSELKSRFVEIDPTFAIKLLTQWIYEAAEHGERLTIEDLEQEIRAIGVVQSKMQAFRNQLGSAIVPLFTENGLAGYDEQTLSNEFYDGVSAKPEHIMAGLDIERGDIENDVETAFRKSNIVIVHGLSGAGKSTFAYRYIYEHASAMAYEIRNCNLKNVNDVLLSLSAIANGLRIPAMFYFDVNPSNPEWIEAISVLAGRKDVRCLVTMRQEDWNIQYPRICTAFNYEDVTLELHREEAERIYNRLLGRDVDIRRSFEVVWEEAEQSGNLLEFIYSLTHGETLENRIEFQINCESEKSKHLLGYIGTANYFGGCINLNGLLQLLDFSTVEVSSLIDKLQYEFFRIEDNVFKDIHPIRTKFIVKALFGNKFLFLKNTAMEIFNKIDISNGHLYILRMMKECGITVDELISEFLSKELSPNQAYSIARALLWCGIYDYERKHKELICELNNQVGSLWEYFVPMNFTGIDIQKSMSVLTSINPNFPDTTEIVSRFDNQKEIFCYLERWLLSRKIFFHPTNHKEWFVLSKFLTLVSWVSPNGIEIIGKPNSQAIKSENMDECAQILLGLKNAGRYDLVLDYERQFIICLRKDYKIIQFKKEKQSLMMLSFLDYNEDSPYRTEDNKGFITERVNMRIIDLCRCAFPEVEEYRSEILKDDLINLFDEMPTFKQIKRDNLPLDEMREPRTVLCNLYKKENGITNRETYANLVLQKRKDYIRANIIVAHFLDEWHKNPQIAYKGYTQLIKELAELADKTEFSIPTSEISEFGYGRSDKFLFDTDKDSNKEADDVYHSVDKFFSGLRTFYYQFPKAIANEGNFKNTASANLFDAMMLLPSFQSNFKNVFYKYVYEEELDTIDKKELYSIRSLWVVWESLREGFDYNSVSHLMQRFEQMKSTLVGKLVDAIKYKWKDCGFDSERLRINVSQKTIKVDFIYTSEADYKSYLYYIQMAVAQKLASYNYFSSQRMVLMNAIDKVIISPLYQLCEGSVVSLDGQRLVCNMDSLFAKADEVVKNDVFFFFVPEQDENDKTTRELTVFNQLIAVMNLIIWTCNKLSSLYELLEKVDDVTGKEIADDYKHLCEKRITETDFTIFDSLLLGLQDVSVQTRIDDAIEVTKSFMSSVASDSTWYMHSDQLKSAFNQLNDIKMYAQVQLLRAINDYSYYNRLSLQTK